MALAYVTPGSSLKGNASLKADIVRGLDWMYANRYNDATPMHYEWFHLEIGAPAELVDTTALMFEELSAAQVANYMRAVEKFTPSATTPAPGGHQVVVHRCQPHVEDPHCNNSRHHREGQYEAVRRARSESGKEATIGILNEGDFFGESCLTGQPVRLCSATAMTDCSVMRIDKKSMMEVLHREHAFSDMFVAYLLTRNIRHEEDLVDQLFNSSEKRLARVLLLLAHFGKEGKAETLIPKISQEMLAEMIGTTRSRVSFFMNRFRKLGFVDYHAGDALQVHSSLLNIVLHD